MAAPNPKYRAGTIEQHLDMYEDGPLRGEEVERSHGREDRPLELVERMEMTLSEEDREGDELSGDEHSSGLQGDESELSGQRHIHTGVPGHEELELDPDDVLGREKPAI